MYAAFQGFRGWLTECTDAPLNPALGDDQRVDGKRSLLDVQVHSEALGEQWSSLASVTARRGVLLSAATS
jgi:hypothetical protein